MLREVIGKQLAPSRGNYSPSVSKAGACPRQLGYWRLGIPESNPTPPRMGLVWAVGDAVEAALDDTLRRSNIPVSSYQRKVRIPFAYGLIYGRLDRVIEPDTVLDYKSINRYGFQEVRETGSPKPETVAQINLYLHGLRLEGERRFTTGRVLYLNKDSGELEEFEFDYDPELAARAIAMFEAVEEHGRAGTLPERPAPYLPGQAPCVYCSWRDVCWGQGAHAPGDQTPADLTPLIDDLERYCALADEIKQLDGQREAIRARVQATLADTGHALGTAGPIRVRLVTVLREKLDASKIPEIFRAAATTVETSTYVRIDPPRESRRSRSGRGEPKEVAVP